MIDKMGAVSGLLSSAVTDAIKSPSLTSKPQALDQASFADAIAKALESASLSADKAADLGKRLQMDDPMPRLKNGDRHEYFIAAIHSGGSGA